MYLFSEILMNTIYCASLGSINNMVMGRQINVIKDVSGKISISVWKAIDPPKNHHDFEVEVDAEGDNGWVCIGGGGRGKPRFFQENTERL